VLTVTISGGAFSAGSEIVFTLPGTVQNALSVQPTLHNIKSCVIDLHGVIIASSVFGTHPSVSCDML
jgi:hypothetical protein